jgi:pyruvate/2-oxoglutarate/acetoin dehydrogenase E1 component
MLPIATTVAEELARDRELSIEVIDPLTLAPLDSLALRESVRKTGRLVVIDEAVAPASAASEIIATIVEDPETAARLQAAPIRVCSRSCPSPYSPILQRAVRPDAPRLIAAIERVVAQGSKAWGRHGKRGA